MPHGKAQKGEAKESIHITRREKEKAKLGPKKNDYRFVDVKRRWKRIFQSQEWGTTLGDFRLPARVIEKTKRSSVSSNQINKEINKFKH